jgi:membrane associated rhomboid family serine protease
MASKEVIIYNNVGDMQSEFNSMAAKYDDLEASGKTNEANTIAAAYFKTTYKPLMHQAHDQISIGASGAIMGLLMAFALIFPNVQLMFMFIPYPIKAKFAVIIYGLMEFSLGFAQIEGDPIGHFAHLGGLIFGFLLMMYWKWRDKRVFH